MKWLLHGKKTAYLLSAFLMTASPTAFLVGCDSDDEEETEPDAGGTSGNDASVGGKGGSGGMTSNGGKGGSGGMTSNGGKGGSGGMTSNGGKGGTGGTAGDDAGVAGR